MEEREEKARQIVRSIRALEGVFKTSPDPKQRERVKNDLKALKGKLSELYPNVDLNELIEAIVTDDLVAPVADKSLLEAYEYLKDIEIEKISNFKDDSEINIAASILKHFSEKIWGVIADQYTKLDYSNSLERDTLYRKLDECQRALKIFQQTVDDIEKANSSAHISQLNLMRTRQGRLFLIDLFAFFKDVNDFITKILADLEFNGTMVLNADDIVTYAKYDVYKTFEGLAVKEALRHLKAFVKEVLIIIKVPDKTKF